jgi:hypothetical protein
LAPTTIAAVSRIPRRTVAIAAVAAAVLAACAVGAVLAIGPLRRAYEDQVNDNVPSGVPCERLPSRAEVERALVARADLVRRIEGIGAVQVQVDSVRCGTDEHAEILVTYPGHDERAAIEAILATDAFGVPVSLRDV